MRPADAKGNERSTSATERARHRVPPADRRTHGKVGIPKIHLSELPRQGDDVDLLNDAGNNGWELVGITNSNIAYLKRLVGEPAPQVVDKPVTAQASILPHRRSRVTRRQPAASIPASTHSHATRSSVGADGVLQECSGGREPGR